MERVEVLIDKLKQQFQQKASREQLLVTVQFLQAELNSSSETSSSPSTKKSVSVIIPSAAKYSVSPVTQTQESLVTESKQVEMLEVDEDEVRAEIEQLKKNATQQQAWSYHGRQAAEEHADAMYDIPTLSSHHAYMPPPPVQPMKQESRREVNEINLPVESSLNEKLKESKTEVAERLQDAPVKDLKKAVGINDRYLYIIELFSGNEAMFDRSIKTLNSFSILPEAEFWMERELKLKLGWNEENPLVKQFIQLVRRRFS